MIQAIQTIDAHGAPVEELCSEYELEDVAVARQEPYVWEVKLRSFSNPTQVVKRHIETYNDRYDVFLSVLRKNYSYDWGLIDWRLVEEPTPGTTEWEF